MSLFRRKTVTALFLALAAAAALGSGVLVLFLSSDDGRMTVDRPVAFPYLEKGRVGLVYFGYVGCRYICLPAMEEMRELFGELEAAGVADASRFFFVSLDPQTDAGVVQNYAGSFHPAFRGLAPDAETLKAMQSDFGFQRSRSPFDSTEISHTGFLYFLIEKNKTIYLKYIYITKPYNGPQIAKDIKKLLKASPDVQPLPRLQP